MNWTTGNCRSVYTWNYVIDVPFYYMIMPLRFEIFLFDPLLYTVSFTPLLLLMPLSTLYNSIAILYFTFRSLVFRSFVSKSVPFHTTQLFNTIEVYFRPLSFYYLFQKTESNTLQRRLKSEFLPKWPPPSSAQPFTPKKSPRPSLSVVGNECRHFSSLFLLLLFQLWVQQFFCSDWTCLLWWIVAVQFARPLL